MRTQQFKQEEKKITSTVTWQEITPGGTIADAGNAIFFKTGDWRSMRPVWIENRCRQCLLCFPVCPDSSILIDKNSKRMDFDFDHCKGCGICAKVCPFKAIDFVEEHK